MAKLGKIVEMKVVDTTTGAETLFKASTSPKKTTVGQSWFGGLNYKGIAKLQEAGINATSEADYLNVLIQVFEKFNVKLDKECFGRGEAWQTPEARARFKVFADGDEWAPALSVKAQKRIEEQVSEVSIPEPALADISAIKLPEQVAPVSPQAFAKIEVGQPLPQATNKDEANVQKIKEYLTKGVSEETIMKGLMVKYPEAKAKELLAQATGPKVSF